jgi:serine protease
MLNRPLATSMLAGLVALVPAAASAHGAAAPGDCDVRTDGQPFAAEAPPPDGLLVDLADDLDEEDVARIEELLSVDLEETSLVVEGNRFELHGSPDFLAAAALKLKAMEGVESVEENVHYSIIHDPCGQPEAVELDEGLDGEQRPSTRPNDPMYKSQWHFDMVNAEGAWAMSKGKDVVVAVIDTGVSAGKLTNGKKTKFPRVPDLRKTEFVKGWNFVAKNADPSDGNGHGTHVAGTIAQSTNNKFGVAGLAYEAKIMPIKVLSDRGFGSVGDIANGIRFAADNKAKVINMSLGGGMYSATLARAVKYAHDKGVTVVCAAGNGGREKVEYPAAYPGCVAVSALGPDGKLAFYSSYGKELDIAAPGGDTRVDLNRDGIPDGVLQDTIARGDPTAHGFFPFQGTSMATPHVAAAAALVIAQGVTDPNEVEQTMQASAKKLNDKIRFGAGGLDAAAAVKKAHEKKAHWSLGFAIALAGWGFVRARRKHGARALVPGLGFATAMLMGASGLFFLRDLGWGAAFGLAAPVAEWPTLFFAGSALNPILGSVLLAIAPVALFFGNQRLRGPIAGFAVGVAGFLLARGVFSIVDVAWIPGHGVLDALWLVGNGVLAAGVGWLVMRKD